MFESIRILDFLLNFWNTVPNSRSNIRQAVLCGPGFSKRISLLKVTISRANSYNFSGSENLISARNFFLTNLNTVEVTHCLNLWFISSQFSFWKCSFDICSLHCNLKQNLMRLFCVSCNWSFSLLVKFGYHAVEA